MAKRIAIEHYRSDGSVRAKEIKAPNCFDFGEVVPDHAMDVGEFYLIWRVQKHKWNGCVRKTLLESITPVGLAVDFKEVQSACCGPRVVPFLVPADE